jgi:hypothetical protein
MSGRVLSFKQYVGGADNVMTIELFPKSQKTFSYNFANADVSGYTFSLDYQSILLDTVSYDNLTGNVNFTSSNVTGYFDNYTQPSANTYINTDDASTGVVHLTIPENRYAGNILPNARSNVVMTVASFEWQTDDTPVQKELHRWAIIERWEPQVTPGDPADNTSPAFIAL